MMIREDNSPLNEFEKSFSRPEFVIYVVENDQDRECLSAVIKFDARKRGMAVEKISMPTVDIDGPVVVENNAYHNALPTWWHADAFLTIVDDIEHIANDEDKYPKFSRLVYLAPGSTSSGGISKRKLPSGSLVRAIIIEEEVTSIEKLISRLGGATQQSITIFHTGKNWKQYDNCTTAILEDVLAKFCSDFIENPYRCYTEHGQHALFYSMFSNAFPAAERDLKFNDFNVCAIQKEYPTCFDLGKSQRQNWDISIIKSPATANAEILAEKGKELFDYLNLFAVVEFGLNERIEHLVDDFLRVSHPNANVDHPYIVHLYRLSDAGDQVSGRDWSANAHDFKKYHNSKELDLLQLLKTLSKGNEALGLDEVKREIKENRPLDKPQQTECKPVTIFFGYVDVSKKNGKKYLYRIANGHATLIAGEKP